MTAGDSLPSDWAMCVFSSTVTDSVLIYESLTNDFVLGSPFYCDSSCMTHCVLSLSLILVLRPTVSRPVSLGIKHPSGAYDQIFISVSQLRICWCGALSLTRGRVSRLQLLLTLASAVMGLATIFYCLRFETFLCVASYDSQGYGGGIRPRLHTGQLI
jgi:hypothetical protein